MLFYFLITFFVSWIFWIPAALNGQEVSVFPNNLFLILGGLGPFLCGTLLVIIDKDKDFKKRFLKRLIDFRQISEKWAAVIFFTFPFINLLAVSLALLQTGENTIIYDLKSILAQPLSFVFFLVSTLFFGPVPEEIGWRGYALPKLQEKFNALGASSILGFLWAIWHIPLFFIQGTYQNSIGFGTNDFWVFLLLFLPETILITWVFNNTRQSTLAAIFFHFMINLSGEITHISGPARLYQFNLLFLLTAVVVLLFGEKTLAEKPDLNRLFKQPKD